MTTQRGFAHLTGQYLGINLAIATIKMEKTLAEECAQALLQVVPQIMRALRTQMRSSRGADLTIPQFRVLGFIGREPRISLSQVAKHMGISLPTASRLVDSLVVRGLVKREISSADHRCIALVLTKKGTSLVAAARRQTSAYLVQILGGVSSAEHAIILQAMEILSPLFASRDRA